MCENGSVLVSVIVPAYNVERYIAECIISIQRQTYSNIEIIIVNDGSKDKTGSIITSIAAADSRIKAIHKANEGVSTARNTGLDVATGKYIMFVDGDDYLAPECVEYMLSLIRYTGSEFCVSKCAYTREGEKQTTNEIVECLSKEKAISLLLSPKMIVGCWNKIYSKEMLDKNQLQFSPELFYGEGLYFIIKAAQLANCVGVGNRKTYYYRRNNEFSSTSQFDISKIYNGEIALHRVREQIPVDDKTVGTMYMLHICMFYLGAVVRMKAGRLEKTYRHEYAKWLAFVRLYAFRLVCNREVPVYRKLLLIGGSISPWLVAKMDIARRKWIVNRSI